MKQRFTVELQRYPRQDATIEITAEGFAEAQAKALDMARSADFPWVSEHEGARITKVICHAGEVADDRG
jgi:Zn-dependent alcohol dehydrogenase